MANGLLNLVWAAQGELKPLAKLVLLRIADRANEHTAETWIGVKAIARDCGLSHQGARNILDRLIAQGYIDVAKPAAGTRPRTLRLNCDRLSSEQRHCSQASEQPRCSQGIETAGGGQPLVSNPVPASEQPGTCLRATPLPQTIRTVGTKKKTDADASECCSQEKKTEERTAEHQSSVPFKVYAAIASEALTDSLRDDRSDNFSNISEHFKTICAQHVPPLPYDGDIARRAIDAALYARNKAKDGFISRYRAVVGRPPEVGAM